MASPPSPLLTGDKGATLSLCERIYGGTASHSGGPAGQRAGWGGGCLEGTVVGGGKNGGGIYQKPIIILAQKRRSTSGREINITLL